MAGKTLTRVQGGVTETIHINRDRFAGVRAMQRNGETITVDRTASVITSDRKGESRPLLSKVVGGAAAAYSLRDLNDKAGYNKVVRVRRESDNSERDFLAKELSNGTLTRWVNEQPTLPLDLRELDTETGERDGALIEAAAAYSLRKLKDDFTGDVVEVRRSSDDATQSFTAAEVADGKLESWVGAGNDGHVKTWYDQSGNTNDAVQTDAAKQPKIVEGGNLLKLNGKPSIDFSTVDGYLELSQEVDTSNKPCSIIAATEPTNRTLIGQTSNRRLIFNSSDAKFGLSVSAITEDYPSVSGGAVFTAIHNGTSTAPNVVIYANGSASTTSDANQGSLMAAGVIDFIGANFGSTVTSYFDKKLPEVIIYNSDQSANRTALEANIGETYGITAIPAANDTVNGYVQTWYDQSGNGYDAREPALQYQPLIVENGSIVTDTDNKVAIKGTGARLRLGHFPWEGESPREMLSDDGTHSLFIVCDLPDQTTGNASYNYISRFHSTSAPYRDKRPRVFLRKTTGELSLAAEANPSKVKVSSSDAQSAQLVTDIVNPSGTTKAEKHSVYIDGAFNAEQPYGTTWIPDGNTTLGKDSKLFTRKETTVDTYISELIYYPSDQSANRPAIETNITNQYGITPS